MARCTDCNGLGYLGTPKDPQDCVSCNSTGERPDEIVCTTCCGSGEMVNPEWNGDSPDDEFTQCTMCDGDGTVLFAEDTVISTSEDINEDMADLDRKDT